MICSWRAAGWMAVREGAAWFLLVPALGLGVLLAAAIQLGSLRTDSLPPARNARVLRRLRF